MAGAVSKTVQPVEKPQYVVHEAEEAAGMGDLSNPDTQDCLTSKLLQGSWIGTSFGV